MSAWNESYTATMESFLRISLAGFGGAMVGLSLAKSKSMQTIGTRLPSKLWNAYRDELPAQWAMACILFSTAFELTRAASPMRALYENIFDDDDDAKKNTYDRVAANNPWRPKPVSDARQWIYTVGDYTVAGAMAGMLLRGMPIAKKKHVMPPRLGAGLGTGLVLGFLPGILIGSSEWLQSYLKKQQQQELLEEEMHNNMLEEEEEGEATPAVTS